MRPDGAGRRVDRAGVFFAVLAFFDAWIFRSTLAASAAARVACRSRWRAAFSSLMAARRSARFCFSIAASRRAASSCATWRARAACLRRLLLCSSTLLISDAAAGAQLRSRPRRDVPARPAVVARSRHRLLDAAGAACSSSRTASRRSATRAASISSFGHQQIVGEQSPQSLLGLAFERGEGETRRPRRVGPAPDHELEDAHGDAGNIEDGVDVAAGHLLYEHAELLGFNCVMWSTFACSFGLGGPVTRAAAASASRAPPLPPADHVRQRLGSRRWRAGGLRRPGRCLSRLGSVRPAAPRSLRVPRRAHGRCVRERPPRRSSASSSRCSAVSSEPRVVRRPPRAGGARRRPRTRCASASASAFCSCSSPSSSELLVAEHRTRGLLDALPFSRSATPPTDGVLIVFCSAIAVSAANAGGCR